MRSVVHGVALLLLRHCKRTSYRVDVIHNQTILVLWHLLTTYSNTFAFLGVKSISQSIRIFFFRNIDSNTHPLHKHKYHKNIINHRFPIRVRLNLRHLEWTSGVRSQRVVYSVGLLILRHYQRVSIRADVTDYYFA